MNKSIFITLICVCLMLPLTYALIYNETEDSTSVDSGIYYFGFTKPQYANWSLLQWKFSNATANYTLNATIPAVCFNQYATRVSLLYGGYVSDALFCDDGGGYQLIGKTGNPTNAGSSTDDNKTLLWDGNWNTGAQYQVTGNLFVDSYTGSNPVRFYEAGMFFDTNPPATGNACNYSGTGNFQVPCYCNLTNINIPGVNITVNETGYGTWTNVTLGNNIAIPKANCTLGWRNITLGK